MLKKICIIQNKK